MNRLRSYPTTTGMVALALVCLGAGAVSSAPRQAGGGSKSAASAAPSTLIGYTMGRTNLPGGLPANQVTMRACVIRPDGTGSRLLAASYPLKAGFWTQFVSWSPDGRYAVIYLCWESAANGQWETENRRFRITPEGWLIDCCLVDIQTDVLRNVTAVGRVSHYNTGLKFLADGKGFSFGGVDARGKYRIYSMDLRGGNKIEYRQSRLIGGWTYGLSFSPDGKRLAYLDDYRLYVSNADGSGRKRVNTGWDFYFYPQWSPDGKWLLFLSGKDGMCSNLYLVSPDEDTPRKLADRKGYIGRVEELDVFDHHHGGSDNPVWSPDSNVVYYTAKVGDRTEIMSVTLCGQTMQLTHSASKVLNYHPEVSPDGKWLVFGSNRTGVRQLYIMTSDGKNARQITSLKPGWGTVHGFWRPG